MKTGLGPGGEKEMRELRGRLEDVPEKGGWMVRMSTKG